MKKFLLRIDLIALLILITMGIWFFAIRERNKVAIVDEQDQGQISANKPAQETKKAPVPESTPSAQFPAKIPEKQPATTLQPSQTPNITPATAEISIANLSFQPANLAISPNTIVTWTNNDAMEHTVTSDNARFSSQILAQGDKFQFTFTEAGSYPYHCTIHPFMTATITVK